MSGGPPSATVAPQSKAFPCLKVVWGDCLSDMVEETATDPVEDVVSTS